MEEQTELEQAKARIAVLEEQLGGFQIHIASAKETLPRQCHNILEDLNRCQSSKQIIVFGCHRKWCSSSYGHCEEVNGIGDRTQRSYAGTYDASIYMSAVDSDNPFLRVFDGVDSYDKWSLGSKTAIKLQLGNRFRVSSKKKP